MPLALSASSSKMEWMRKMGGGCLRNNQGKGVLKIEGDSGGQDFFNASPRAVPDHLVIMVNGLVGRCTKILLLLFSVYSF